MFRGLLVAAFAAGVVTAYTDTYSPAMAGAVFLSGAFVVDMLPDWVFERPDPSFERSKTTSEGMTDREVMERVAIEKERKQYRKELIDEEVEKSTSSNDTPVVRNL